MYGSSGASQRVWLPRSPAATAAFLACQVPYAEVDSEATVLRLANRRVGAKCWARGNWEKHVRDADRKLQHARFGTKATVSLQTNFKFNKQTVHPPSTSATPVPLFVDVTFSSTHLPAYKGTKMLDAIKKVSDYHDPPHEGMQGLIKQDPNNQQQELHGRLHVWCGDWNPRFMLRDSDSFDGTEPFDDSIKTFAAPLGTLPGDSGEEGQDEVREGDDEEPLLQDPRRTRRTSSLPRGPPRARAKVSLTSLKTKW